MSAVLAEPEFTIEKFESGRLNHELFDHEAHVYVGWLFVGEFGLAAAISRFDAALKRLTRQLGVPGKYHATITWMFLLLIGERFRDDEGWQEFRSRNQDLIADCKTTLGRYYSDEYLFSDDARRRFVLPDKLRD